MNQTEVEGNIRLEIVVTPSEGPECQQGEAMSLIQIATYQLSHSTVLNTVVNTQQSWARKATFATIRQHIFCIISDGETPSEGPESRQGEAMSLIQIETSHTSTV